MLSWLGRHSNGHAPGGRDSQVAEADLWIPLVGVIRASGYRRLPVLEEEKRSWNAATAAARRSIRRAAKLPGRKTGQARGATGEYPGQFEFRGEIHR